MKPHVSPGLRSRRLGSGCNPSQALGGGLPRLGLGAGAGTVAQTSPDRALAASLAPVLFRWHRPWDSESGGCRLKRQVNLNRCGSGGHPPRTGTQLQSDPVEAPRRRLFAALGQRTRRAGAVADSSSTRRTAGRAIGGRFGASRWPGRLTAIITYYYVFITYVLLRITGRWGHRGVHRLTAASTTRMLRQGTQSAPQGPVRRGRSGGCEPAAAAAMNARQCHSRLGRADPGLGAGACGFRDHAVTATRPCLPETPTGGGVIF